MRWMRHYLAREAPTASSGSGKCSRLCYHRRAPHPCQPGVQEAHLFFVAVSSTSLHSTGLCCGTRPGERLYAAGKGPLG